MPASCRPLYSVRLCLWLVLFLMLAHPALAHKPDDPPHQTFALGDFALGSGNIMETAFLSYVTQGTLNAARDNAILVTTAFAANHHHLDPLVGPGKALDTSRFFVITVDSFGNGLSSSPSNSAAQKGMCFPRFTLLDMVRAQKELVTRQFGITSLAAVVGTSMGGMQALQWAAAYPGMVRRCVAVGAEGRTPPWMRVHMDLLRQCIMADPAWQQGDYRMPPEAGLRLWAGLLFGLLMHTPESMEARWERAPDKTLPWLHGLQDAAWNIMDANDILYQSWACADFDLAATPGAGGDYEAALRAISAPTLLLVAEKDMICPESPMEKDAAHIPRAALRRLDGSPPLGHYAATGHGSRIMEPLAAALADFLHAPPEQP